MSWSDIWKIIVSILASVGGIGGIILLVIKFSANIIANKLSQKYDAKLKKENEKYKSGLENKTYITKTKFDAEFSIYRQLSKDFFELAKNIQIMIPYGYTKVPVDEVQREKAEEQAYRNAVTSLVKAEDTLNCNSPFIQENIYNHYRKILALCGDQTDVFSDRWNMSYLSPLEDRKKLSVEDYKRTKEIKDELSSVNSEIKIYLDTLDVME